MTIKMKLSAASANGVARLHMLPGLAFGYPVLLDAVVGRDLLPERVSRALTGWRR